MSIKTQIANELVKLSPPIGVVGSHIMGVNWPDVAYILTAIYTVLMSINIVRGWFGKRKK